MNCSVLAMDKNPISDAETAVIELSNLFFSSIFIVEMLLKITALGFSCYLHDKMNVFDTVIAFICALDIISYFFEHYDDGCEDGNFRKV